jgi:hypothetical protein
MRGGETPGQKYRREKAEAAAKAAEHHAEKAHSEGSRIAAESIAALDDCDRYSGKDRDNCIKAAINAGFAANGRAAYVPPPTRRFGGSRKTHARRKGSRKTHARRKGSRKTHARRKGSRKTRLQKRRTQRGGAESKLMAAAKAGRLTSEGKGNKDSVLEILDGLILRCTDAEHYTNSGLHRFKQPGDFTDSDLTKYLNILRKMPIDIQEKLSDAVSEKLNRGKARYTDRVTMGNIVMPGLNNAKRAAIDSKKEKIVKILTTILGFKSKGFNNPARGIETPPRSPAGSSVHNPLFGKDKVFNNPLRAKNLPAGWEEVTDPDDGEIYYYNTKTGVSQWTRP